MQSPLFRRAVLLAAAVAWDLTLGEPHPAAHPVVWMGRAVAPFKRLRGRTRTRDFLAGSAVVVAITSASVTVGLKTSSLRTIAGLLFSIGLLKSCFSVRSLFSHVSAVESRLRNDDVDAARESVAHIVSRDVRALAPHQIAAAAIESLSENTSDSVVAPLVYFLLAGLPGALFYRSVNTLDAEIGYRGDLEWFGKTAARLDDVLNFIPSRITGFLIVAAAPMVGGSPLRSWRVMTREGDFTPSPNAGRPMAAMAGALEVELQKPGEYVLGRGARQPDHQDLRRALLLARIATALALVLALALALVGSAISDRMNSR